MRIIFGPVVRDKRVTLYVIPSPPFRPTARRTHGRRPRTDCARVYILLSRARRREGFWRPRAYSFHRFTAGRVSARPSGGGPRPEVKRDSGRDDERALSCSFSLVFSLSLSCSFSVSFRVSRRSRAPSKFSKRCRFKPAINHRQISILQWYPNRAPLCPRDAECPFQRRRGNMT